MNHKNARGAFSLFARSPSTTLALTDALRWQLRFPFGTDAIVDASARVDIAHGAGSERGAGVVEAFLAFVAAL